VDFENAPMEIDFSRSTLCIALVLLIIALVVIAKGRD
jgi:hypothetical protein